MTFFVQLTVILRGSAIFCEEKNLCIIDNTFDGYDIHAFDTGAFLRTLKSEPSGRTFPRQVALGENDTIVVGGSNSGRIGIYDQLRGELIQALVHSSSGKCQTVTVSQHSV